VILIIIIIIIIGCYIGTLIRTIELKLKY